MKQTLLLCTIFFLNVAFAPSVFSRFFRNLPPPPTGPLPRIEIVSEYFIQKLDHFDYSNNVTWNQRYYVNTEFFDIERQNVAFIFLGGEGEISKSWMVHGSWITSAKKYGALLFQLEHRYYGKSQPFPDLSVKNLRYLSSQQALADAANFIEAMNQEYSLSADVKWIAFGGSYAGSLSAWMRLKYPNLVHGAVSSSAPLFAKLDFSEYYQVVVNNLRNSDKRCVRALKTAVKQVEHLLRKPTSSKNVTNLFNLCQPIEGRTGLDVENFYNLLSSAPGVTSQYNKKIGYTIDEICNILTDPKLGSEMYRLRHLMKTMEKELEFGKECLNYTYEDDASTLRNMSGITMNRQWYYQTCTEFGWYQSTNRKDKVFGEGCTANYYTTMCHDVFGFNKTYIEGKIKETNACYGGTTINATNVVYIHGSLDPWHAIGLIKPVHLESPVIMINGTAHCADMYETKPEDLPQLTEAREKVDTIIGTWLKSS